MLFILKTRMLELPALRQIRIFERGAVIGWKWAPYVYTSYVTIQTEKKNSEEGN